MEPGKHDFSGYCAPNEKGSWKHQETFSVGIFQWLPKANWDCCKKSAVIVKVKGQTSDPEAVYAKAREIVAQLDAGTYTGTKNVTVR